MKNASVILKMNLKKELEWSVSSACLFALTFSYWMYWNKYIQFYEKH